MEGGGLGKWARNPPPPSTQSSPRPRYLVFGNTVSPVITQDAADAAQLPWEQALVTTVLCLVSWATYSTTVPVVAVLTDFVSPLVPSKLRARVSVAGLRIALCLALAVTAFPTRDYLGYLCTGIGIISLLVTLLIPLIFHHCMFRAELGCLARLWSYFLITVCIALTVIIGYNSIYELLETLGYLGDAASA